MLQEGFAFAHCTECRAMFHLLANMPADRWWLRLKFQLLVVRDHAMLFIVVQMVRTFLIQSLLLYFPFSYLGAYLILWLIIHSFNIQVLIMNKVSIAICLICNKKGLLHFLLVAQRKEFSEDLLLWIGGGFYGHASVCSIWR